MKIKILLIGKTDEGYLIEGIEKYLKRLKHYIATEILIIPDIKKGLNTTTDKQKLEEGKLILDKIEHQDYVILLDEKGKSYTSEAFSKYLEKKMNTLNSSIILVVGGPYGFSDEIYQRANDTLSLSAMTFSHQMVRLFLVEQLYRAFTILRGEKYHHK